MGLCWVERELEEIIIIFFKKIKGKEKIGYKRGDTFHQFILSQKELEPQK